MVLCLLEEHGESIDGLLLGTDNVTEVISLALDLEQKIAERCARVRRLSGGSAGFVRWVSGDVRRRPGARRHGDEPPTISLDAVEPPAADAPAHAVIRDPEPLRGLHQIDELGVR
jgi:hypothetical protein